MRLFNSLQIVGFYAGAPWLLGYLFRQTFPFHTAACVAAVVLYGIFSLMMVGCVYTAAEKWDR